MIFVNSATPFERPASNGKCLPKHLKIHVNLSRLVKCLCPSPQHDNEESITYPNHLQYYHHLFVSSRTIPKQKVADYYARTWYRLNREACSYGDIALDDGDYRLHSHAPRTFSAARAIWGYLARLRAVKRNRWKLWVKWGLEWFLL